MVRLLNSPLVLVFGGEDDNDNCLSDMYSFHLARAEWSRIKYAEGPTPCGRFLHTATAISSSAIVVLCGESNASGEKGTHESTSKNLNDVWVFDVLDRSWRQVQPSGQSPAPRSCHSAVYGYGPFLPPAVYLFGGLDVEGSRVYRLRIHDWEWETLNVQTEDNGTQCCPRESHGAVWLEKYNGMCVVGGDGGDGLLDDCWLFTPAEKKPFWKWDQVRFQMALGKAENKLPFMAGHSLIPLSAERTQVLIWGGLVGKSGSESSGTKSAFVLDFDELQVRHVAISGNTPNAGRLLHGMVRYNNKVFVFGGCDAKGKAMSDLQCAELLQDLKTSGTTGVDTSPVVTMEATSTTTEQVNTQEDVEMSDIVRQNEWVPLVGPSKIKTGTPLSGRIIDATDCGYFVSVVINGKLYKGVLVANPLKDGETIENSIKVEKEGIESSNSKEPSAKRRREERKTRVDPNAALLKDLEDFRPARPSDFEARPGEIIDLG